MHNLTSHGNTITFGPNVAQTNMHDRPEANSSTSLAARQDAVIEQSHGDCNSPPSHKADAAHKTPPTMQLSPSSSSSPSHMHHLHEEVERGRTLKRKRRSGPGSPKRGHCRTTAQVQQRKQDFHGDGESDSDEDYAAGNDIWKDFIQEAIMAELVNTPNIPPPSRSRSRGSKSPVRKQILQLRTCQPSVVFSTDSELKSERLIELRQTLRHAASTAFINAEMLARLDDVDRDDLSGQDTNAFRAEFGAVDVDKLFERVEAIERDAKKCQKNMGDEAAWTNVTKSVLKAALKLESAHTSACRVLETFDIRNQSIAERYLPVIAADPVTGKEAAPVPLKKTDVILAWDEDVGVAQELAESLAQRKPLSHLSHDSSQYRPLQCAIEVKTAQAGTAAEEARLQLALCHASALRHMIEHGEGLDENNMDSKLPLQIGWIVSGHRWEYYISYYHAATNTVTFAGPLGRIVFGTDSRVGLLQLIAVLRRMIRWLVTEYWDSYSSLLAGTAPAA